LIKDEDMYSIEKQIQGKLDKNLFQKTFARILNVIRENHL
jgi:hypothetical protein